MDYIPAGTPATASPPLTPKPAMGFGVSSSLKSLTPFPSEKLLYFLCRTRRKCRKCPYFSPDLLLCLKSSGSLSLQGTETWKSISNYGATKADIKQSNNINITNTKQNSNRSISRFILQISIWNSLYWLECLFSVFGDWHSVTFTPSLPLMLTARIINKEWKHKQLHTSLLHITSQEILCTAETTKKWTGR